MSITSSRLIRSFVLAVLVAALVIPAQASALNRKSARSGASVVPMGALSIPNDVDDNGDISTADAIPASPINGQLTYNTDYDDVFVVHLAAGEHFTARVLSSTSGTDFDLYLFAPGASSVETATPVAIAENEYSSPDTLYRVSDDGLFVAPADGDYYLDVYCADAPSATTAYNYTVQWAKGIRPAVAIGSSASVVPYKGSVNISGTVKDNVGVGLVGQPVELWAVAYPNDTFLRKAGMNTTTGGAYSFTTALDRWTYYKVIALTNVGGYSFGESAAKGVKSKVALGAPRLTSGTKYHGKAFTVYGYLKPRHAAGAKHVKITAYRYDYGVWRTAKNYTYNSTTTKYKTTIVLPYKGKWKLVASTPDDGTHAATTSSAKYVTVK